MKKLFILSGGVGSEREVSLLSGRNVVDTLRSEGVVCEEIIVEKDKSFRYQGMVMSEEEGLELLQKENALVFQLIHGTYGEDGELIGELKERGISYIGSSKDVLALTINKYETEKVLRENNIITTQSVLVERMTSVPTEILFPVIVKPNTEGSSVGVVKVNNQGELQEAVRVSLEIHKEVLVQECVEGREFSCGVLEIDGEITALPVTEVILTKGEMFDYEAKYTVGGCKEITPAEVDEVMTKRIQEVALRTHIVTGCKDISRTDMIVRGDGKAGEIVVLEINTVPGMTRTSFIPEEMRVAGYTLSQFVVGMMEKYS